MEYPNKNDSPFILDDEQLGDVAGGAINVFCPDDTYPRPNVKYLHWRCMPCNFLTRHEAPTCPTCGNPTTEEWHTGWWAD